MIAVDTNLLVYAHRADAEQSEKAYRCLRQLAEAAAPWAIPWPCVHEFLAIVTHRRIYDPPSPLPKALAQIDAWLESPGLSLLSESRGYEAQLQRLLREGGVTGARVHDARVAALCLHHGVTELWSADRDCSRFPQLTTHNPLVG